ncbi:MAG: amidohydrolase family protein [Acidimicrobiales bacterium]
MSEPNLNVDSLAAIDVHVHVEQDARGHFSLDQELMDASAKYFKSGEDRAPKLEVIADRYRALNMAAVVFTVDAHTATGHDAISSAEVADGARKFSDVLIPFGSVDPLTGPAALDTARGLVADHGVRGFKFHPSLQGFRPNDYQHYALYEVIEELDVPVIFHTGQTGIGAGLPGGRGIKLALSDPLLLDEVAADFPGLRMVLAHAGMPWYENAIAMATHKANVYLDLSGWSPKYLPAPLVRAATSYLSHKVLFGSDFPVITPERWLRDFEAVEVSDEIRAKIMKQNAVALLHL